jgi:hypothetical protein
MADGQHWRPILFNCPRTGSKVQALLVEEPTGASARYEGAGTRYETVSCLACSGIHLVDPIDGKVLGAAPNGMR